MKYTLTLLLLIALQMQVKGQKDCNCLETKEQSKNFEEKILAEVFVNKVVGSANQFYLGWINGDIILKDGSIIKNENLRYNRFLDELMWVRKKDYSIGIVNKELVASFILKDPKANEPMVFLNLKKKSWISVDSGSYYMQELTKGKLSFYLFRKAQKVGDNKELSIKNEYYIVKNNIFYRVRLSRRSLYKFMDFERDKMKDIVKENRLNLKEEGQFAKALKIYNEKY